MMTSWSGSVMSGTTSKPDPAPRAPLPRITRFLGTSDGGPSDGKGSAICPHCGASGRYVHYFECEDGTKRGAMSGCIKLFPVSPIAQADLALNEKHRDLQKRFGKGATLNTWDKRIREAIDAFYAGTMGERTALDNIQWARQAAATYRQSRRRR